MFYRLRPLFFIIFLILYIFGCVISPVLAGEPAPDYPFNSAFQIQNLQGETITCTYQIRNYDGVIIYESPSPLSIPRWDRVLILLHNLPMRKGASSIKVECTGNAAAIVNFSDIDSGASFNAVSNTNLSPLAYIPTIYDNYYNYYSNIYVRNVTGSKRAVTVSIYPPNSSIPILVQNKEIAAYGTHVFTQEGLDKLSQNVYYTAKVQSTGNIVATANIYGKGSVNNQLYSSNAVSGGSINAYAPIIMNNFFGFNTALVIQNLSGSPNTVAVKYSAKTDADVHTIPGNSVLSLYTPNEDLPEGNVMHSALVVSNSGLPILVTVNQSGLWNRAASYNGFRPIDISTKAYAPLVYKNYYGFTSSVTCQNLSSQTIRFKIKYYYKGLESDYSWSPDIGINRSHVFLQETDPNLPPGVTASAVIESVPAGNIACVVNQNMLPGSIGDFLYSYNAIKQ